MFPAPQNLQMALYVNGIIIIYLFILLTWINFMVVQNYKKIDIQIVWQCT